MGRRRYRLLHQGQMECVDRIIDQCIIDIETIGRPIVFRPKTGHAVIRIREDIVDWIIDIRTKWPAVIGSGVYVSFGAAIAGFPREYDLSHPFSAKSVYEIDDQEERKLARLFRDAFYLFIHDPYLWTMPWPRLRSIIRSRLSRAASKEELLELFKRLVFHRYNHELNMNVHEYAWNTFGLNLVEIEERLNRNFEAAEELT